MTYTKKQLNKSQVTFFNTSKKNRKFADANFGMKHERRNMMQTYNTLKYNNIQY